MLTESRNLLAKNGICVPEILMPNRNVDLSKWSVIACDQYTSQPDYWEKTTEIVGDEPSTLKVTLPEIYLEQDDFEARIDVVNSNMEEYLNDGVLESMGSGFVLVKRFAENKLRTGLVVAVDLEAYDFQKGSNSLIRATEGTVIDRLPPRMKIRKNALIELPHIMVLIDDKDKTIIEPLAKKYSEGVEKLYSVDLMQEGGHIDGWFVNSDEDIAQFADSLEQLSKKVDLLFAVGDGNHSLASAKQHWNEVKAAGGDVENHPARYALVELVNIHDDGLEFEPIHRVLFNCNYKDLLGELEKFVVAEGGLMEVKYFVGQFSHDRLFENWEVIKDITNSQTFAFVTENICGMVVMENTDYSMTVGTVQAFLDEYLAEHNDCRIDYIHGEDVTSELGSLEGNVGIILPNMAKSQLFKAVVEEGVLPRKTFSMGEANEKRYYMESRKIK